MSAAIAEAIRETVDAARDLRAREDALRAAVASGDGTAIIEAARAFFEETDAERCDRPAPRVE